MEEKAELVKSLIRTIPDFPKPGIQFRDVTTLMKDKEGFQTMLDLLNERYKDKKIDVIVGVEARGFIIGGALAYLLGCGFVPARKPGKLPYKTVSQEYELEYGTDKLEAHVDAIEEGQNVLVIDDLIATGGTMEAACKLVEQLKGNVVECACVVELPTLKGRERVKHPLHVLVQFEGD